MPSYAFRGHRPQRHATAWVAPDADLIGDVVLAEDVSVWFHAVIRADNGEIPIGARSNVQDGAMLHSDADAPLSVGADCTIGDRVLIGMGAIVLNHAVIGDDCIVGAGALVTEGKTFPPGSLIVGSPARAVKQLDDRTIAFLKLSAAHYVQNGRDAAQGLERVED